MSGMAIGSLAILIMIFLLVFRLHIGLTMLIGGAFSYLMVNNGNFNALLYTLNNLMYSRLSDYNLVVIPLFVLMGQIATHGGLSKTLFQSAATFVGHLKGGLGISAIGACAGFGAICGSSLATSATMSKVVIPQLRQHHYSGQFATATVAVGGTLGILIPPSVPLIIYAVLTQESIARMFVAAIIPATLAVFGYIVVVWFLAHKMAAAKDTPRASAKEMLKAFINILPIYAIFFVIIIGIYGGWSNPTEAAAIGVGACFFLAITQGKMRWQGLKDSLMGTANTTGMIFFILIGADLLNSGLAVSQMPTQLAQYVISLNLPPISIIIAILILYVILGCLMDSLSMILLTIPIFLPIIVGLDLFGLNVADKIVWFGLLSLMVVEIGLITPPMGMNLFIVQKEAKDVPFFSIAKGVVPFLFADFVRIALLVIFPSLTLYLLQF